jgi:hypothetical protein
MRHARGCLLLGVALPVLVANRGWAAEEQPGEVKGATKNDEAKAETRKPEGNDQDGAAKQTEAKGPSVAPDKGAEAGADRPTKEEALPLKKRLERLRSARSGDVESVAVEDPGSRIAPAQPVARTETGVPPRAPKLERPESLPELAGREKERWFQTREWRDRFGDLRRCPGEVAMKRSVRPRAVPAGRVLLRWTIDLEGRVRDAAVVAGGSVDPDVMSCIHRKMSAWQLVPRPTTPYRADWTLTLR